MKYTENLIEAMIKYGMDANWNDNDIIESLIDCGITEQDFRDCGYWSYVRAYFEED